MLRADDEELALAPQPSLAQLDVLAGQVREAGLPVEVEVEGEPRELPPGVDVSAYRIVQEALTNALKHAGPARALVRVALRRGRARARDRGRRRGRRKRRRRRPRPPRDARAGGGLRRRARAPARGTGAATRVRARLPL